MMLVIYQNIKSGLWSAKTAQNIPGTTARLNRKTCLFCYVFNYLNSVDMYEIRS